MFLTKVAALTLLPVALMGGVVANSSIMLVEVDADDVHIMVPVPLSLAQVAVAFAPDEAKYVDVEEAGQYIPYLADFVDALRDVPENVMLVEVIDGDDHVQVFLEDDNLRVSVDEGHDRGATVNVRVPLASVAAMVDAYDADTNTLRTSRLVGALRAAPSGDLVHVIDGDEEVRIRMW
ncbi:MAG: hypothetical protein GKS06_08405 [Acidobacteria bacterium]|nr:hypothetical protein [Acidobacteriota bacterium]